MAPVSSDESSFLHTERISQYVSLPPAALATPLPALCASVFSPLLLSYFPPARGIILAYEDVTLSSSPPAPASSQSKSQPTQQDTEHAAGEEVMLRHIDEYASPFLWATATFLVWRPQQNKWITGRVTHQSRTHITLSHLNLFPVSILSAHLPSTWTFRQTEAGKVNKGWDGRPADEEGVWVKENGEEVAGDVEVRVVDFEGRMDVRGKGKGFLRLEGSLLSEDEATSADKAKGKGKAGRGVLKRTQSARQDEVTERE
jgi:DNA-directed RNA polymerase I subunit RPA43